MTLQPIVVWIVGAALNVAAWIWFVRRAKEPTPTAPPPHPKRQDYVPPELYDAPRDLPPPLVERDIRDVGPPGDVKPSDDFEERSARASAAIRGRDRRP